MSNSWFQFKHFMVQQDACAMKITTDACIQGAWTAIPHNTATVLDIGTGTGLLSLMLAQRHPQLHIHALDTDAAAATQAAANIATSPWATRIHVSHTDIRHYTPTTTYDLIICNPPFFKAGLLSGNREKDMARHDVSLNHHQLLQAVSALLAPRGTFSLLLPYTEYQQWLPLIGQYDLYEQQILHVKHHPEAPIKRVVSILSKTKDTPVKEETLIIKNTDGTYTAQFTHLLKDFYLDL